MWLTTAFEQLKLFSYKILIHVSRVTHDENIQALEQIQTILIHVSRVTHDMAVAEEERQENILIHVSRVTHDSKNGKNLGNTWNFNPRESCDSRPFARTTSTSS